MTTLVMMQVAAVAGVPLTSKASKPLTATERLHGVYELFPFADRLASLLEGFKYAENTVRKLSPGGLTPSGEQPSGTVKGVTVSGASAGESTRNAQAKSPHLESGEKPAVAQKGAPISGASAGLSTKPAPQVMAPLTEQEKLVALATGVSTQSAPAGEQPTSQKENIVSQASAGQATKPEQASATAQNKAPLTEQEKLIALATGVTTSSGSAPTSQTQQASKTTHASPVGQTAQSVPTTTTTQNTPATQLTQATAPQTEEQKLIALATGTTVTAPASTQKSPTTFSGASAGQATQPQQATGTAQTKAPLTEQEKLIALATGVTTATSGSSTPFTQNQQVSKNSQTSQVGQTTQSSTTATSQATHTHQGTHVKAPLTEEEKLIALATGVTTTSSTGTHSTPSQQSSATTPSSQVGQTTLSAPTTMTSQTSQSSQGTQAKPPLTEQEKLIALATGQTFRQVKITSCPKKLNVNIKKTIRGLEYKLDTPIDGCLMSPFLENPTLADVSSKTPIFGGTTTPSFVPNKDWAYSATGKDMLKCESKSFPRIRVTDFAQFLLSELRSPRGLKIPQPVADLIFGARPGGEKAQTLPASWKSPYVNDARDEVRDEFEKVGRASLLILSQSEAKVAGTSEDCFYVKAEPEAEKKESTSKSVTAGNISVRQAVASAQQKLIAYATGAGPKTTTATGPPSIASTTTTAGTGTATTAATAITTTTAATTGAKGSYKNPLEKFQEHIAELFEAMVPVIMRSALPPFKPTPLNLHLTDHRCHGASGDLIDSIALAPLQKSLASYDAPSAIPVRIGGKSCATASMQRFLEAEDFVKKTPFWKPISEALSGLEKLLIAKVESASERSATLEKGAPKGYVNEINEAIAKTLVTFGLIDLSRCAHLKDRTGFGLLVVDLPTKSLCGEGRMPFNCQSLDDGRTAILMRPSNTEAPCMFTSSLKLKPHKETEKKTVPLQSAHTGPSSGAIHSNTKIPHSGTKPSVGNKSPAYVAHGPIGNVRPTGPQPKGVHGASAPHGPPAHKPHMHSPPGKSPFAGMPPLPFIGKPEKLLACFPASSHVLRSDRRLVAMRDLRVGEHIEVAPGVFSPVLLFTHADAAARTRMVMLESAHGKLVASRTHYVISNDALVAAGDIQVGDFITVKRKHGLVHERVIRASEKEMDGLYNPQTKNGRILVRVGSYAPVLASAYTTAVPPLIAHWLLTPLRWLFDLIGITLPGISGLFPGTDVGHASEGETLVSGLVRNVMTGLAILK